MTTSGQPPDRKGKKGLYLGALERITQHLLNMHGLATAFPVQQPPKVAAPRTFPLFAGQRRHE
jgi:hypothetical protein